MLEVALGRQRKMWIDTVKDCLTKRGLDARHAKRIGKDRIEWRWFVGRNARGVARGYEPST